MAIAWFIIPYKRRVGARQPTRYCAIDDFTPQIYSAGGKWSETEILGDRAIVKVSAPANILTALNAEYKRLPKDRLDDSLSDLSAGAKTAIRNELQDAGYSLAEIQARFGSDLGAFTLRDVLRFFASRRLKPRYDVDTDTIILDGSVQVCRSIDEVDEDVT